MLFHQRRFFVYPSGAPGLHTLSSVSSHSHTLVTTDRCVSLLCYGDSGYSLRKINVDALRSNKANVVASAVIERPKPRELQVVVAYSVGESLYLEVLTLRHEPLDNAEAADVPECEKFELQAAPTCMFHTQAFGTNGDFFYGVVVCCIDSMLAIGFIENEKKNPSIGSDTVCIRLDNEQFATFFPEFVAFKSTVLAVDIVTSPEKDQGWIAFGCADGLVRVFHGQNHGGCLSGPFKTKDLQLNGPVTSIALYLKQSTLKEDAGSSWCCNVLVTCAIGQALVYEDLFDTLQHIGNGEVLMDSDTFDSIFAGIVADIDLDGQAELLLGTDSQVMLAYKERSDDISRHMTANEAAKKSSFEPCVEESTAASPMSPGSTHNIWDELETTPAIDEGVSSANESSLARWKWQRLSRSQWDLNTFGAIYSLLWRDVNHDGVPELLVASSTGIYVYEADPGPVIHKLEYILSALPSARLPPCE